MASREFQMAEFSQSVKENALRLLDNQDSTLDFYHSRFQNMYKRHKSDNVLASLTKIVNDLKDKTRKRALSWNTIRLYRSVISFGVTLIYTLKFEKEIASKIQDKITAEISLPVGGLLESNLNRDNLQQLYNEVINIDSSDKVGVGESKQTSSSKMKYFPVPLYRHIMADERLKKNYPILRMFIQANSLIGLRPIEWFDASFENKSNREGYAGCVIVNNAKQSFGRAGVATRTLHIKQERLLVGCQKLQRVMLAQANASKVNEKPTKAEFSEYLDKLQEKFNYYLTSDSTVMRILKTTRQRRARAKSVKPNQLPLMVPTLYTTRHQAVANAKISPQSLR